MHAPANGSFCANAMKIAAGILGVWQGNLKLSVAKTMPFCRRCFIVRSTLKISAFYVKICSHKHNCF